MSRPSYYWRLYVDWRLYRRLRHAGFALGRAETRLSRAERRFYGSAHVLFRHLAGTMPIDEAERLFEANLKQLRSEGVVGSAADADDAFKRTLLAAGYRSDSELSNE